MISEDIGNNSANIPAKVNFVHLESNEHISHVWKFTIDEHELTCVNSETEVSNTRTSSLWSLPHFTWEFHNKNK